jgi:hypothetical protein
MKYRVFDADKAPVTVEESDLQKWFGRAEPPPVQIVRAAAQTKDDRFLPLVRRAYASSDSQTRITSVLAWLRLGGGVGEVRKMAEKAAGEGWVRELDILKAALLRLEKGSNAATNPYRSFETPGEVDLLMPSILGHLKHRDAEDICLLAEALQAYSARALPWLRDLRQDLWESDLLTITEALATAVREGELEDLSLKHLQQVADAIEALLGLGKRVDSLALENATEVIGGMPRSIALPILASAGRRKLPKRVEKMLNRVREQLAKS